MRHSCCWKTTPLQNNVSLQANLGRSWLAGALQLSTCAVCQSSTHLFSQSLLHELACLPTCQAGHPPASWGEGGWVGAAVTLPVRCPNPRMAPPPTLTSHTHARPPPSFGAAAQEQECAAQPIHTTVTKATNTPLPPEPCPPSHPSAYECWLTTHSTSGRLARLARRWGFRGPGTLKPGSAKTSRSTSRRAPRVPPMLYDSVAITYCPSALVLGEHVSVETQLAPCLCARGSPACTSNTDRVCGLESPAFWPCRDRLPPHTTVTRPETSGQAPPAAPWRWRHPVSCAAVDRAHAEGRGWENGQRGSRPSARQPWPVHKLILHLQPILRGHQGGWGQHLRFNTAPGETRNLKAARGVDRPDVRARLQPQCIQLEPADLGPRCCLQVGCQASPPNFAVGHACAQCHQLRASQDSTRLDGTGLLVRRARLVRRLAV